MMGALLKILAVEFDVAEEIEDWLGLCEWKRNELARQSFPRRLKHPLSAAVHLV